MAGRFVTPVPDGKGKDIAHEGPITGLRRNVVELRDKALAGVAVELAGIVAEVSVKDNVATIRGEVIMPETADVEAYTGPADVITGIEPELNVAIEDGVYFIKLSGRVKKLRLEFVNGLLSRFVEHYEDIPDTKLEAASCDDVT